MKGDNVDVDQFPAAVRSTTRSTRASAARCRCSPTSTASTTTRRCSRRPASRGRRRRSSELTADAKKLTQRNADGTIKVAGFDPTSGFYENAPAALRAARSARSGSTTDGKSNLAGDPNWVELLQWQKELVDCYGYDKLVRFHAGAGDEFSASNAFETGKVAMKIDGECRTAFLTDEHPELKYGTAPMPVDDAKPSSTARAT